MELLTGKFHLGCNYWSSNAGCFMWQRWDSRVVESDLALLARHGLRTLRVFPLWSDFQPLRVLYGEFGRAREVRLAEQPPGTDLIGRACLDPVMVRRFETLCDLAEKYDIQLTVMLLTGWMSGRQFKPEPLQALNTYTDPLSLKWQVRFVTAFVNHFKSFPAIIAWGLGNESNVMSHCPSAEAAYAWTALIANTIRAADPDRPVVSGMHGLAAGEGDNAWRIQDQGECCDVMTTHPYSVFVPHCQVDSLLSIRNTMHAAAESTLYSDLTGKPCFTEEIGDLGSTLISRTASKTYLETVLWSCWANGNLGCLWWCAFQQDHLEQPPYDWFMFEQDLGLFERDGKARPVVAAMSEFDRMLNSLDQRYRVLPPRNRDAVCVVTHGQDQWAAALGAFILAKQAGFDIRFVAAEQPLPAAEAYMLPSLCGLGALPRRQWHELFRRVRELGASLYLSVYDALLPDLAGFAGLEVQARQALRSVIRARFAGGGELLFPADQGFPAKRREGGIVETSRPYKLITRSVGAEVLAADAEGVPMFCRFHYGRGRVYFLNVALEMVLAKNPGCFEADAPDYARFYRTFAEDLIGRRAIRKSPRLQALALTEHPIDSERLVCVGVNHSTEKIETDLQIDPAVSNVRPLAGEVVIGEGRLTISVPAGKGFVVELARR